jgi:hypothetical protein
MAILLVLEISDTELLSGIPEYVLLSTNIPSTIFYTFDGSDPTTDSEIFIEKLYLPSNSAVTLKARAYSITETSSILEESFVTNQTGLDNFRLTGREGINILKVNEPIVDHLSFDSDGYESQTTSISFIELDMQASEQKSNGEDISGNTTIDFVNLSKRTFLREAPPISDVSSINFDPRARMIIIDGSTTENFDNQTIRIINRPHGSLDLLSKENIITSSEWQLNSSGLVRTMINPKTGKMVFYYRDSRENRWIQSIQTTEMKKLNLGNRPGAVKGFVFEWVEYRAQTKIF